MTESSFMTSLKSGGMAGMAVDISLFPLDTIKTRLQSKQGFWKSGGFRNIYSGLGPAAAGSAPNAAIFFCMMTFFLQDHTFVSLPSILKFQIFDVYHIPHYKLSVSTD